MAETKSLADLTSGSDQTDTNASDLLYIERTGTPKRITFTDLFAGHLDLSGGTMTGTIVMGNPAPEIDWLDTDATVGQQRWRIVNEGVDDTSLLLRPVEDDGTVASLGQLSLDRDAGGMNDARLALTSQAFTLPTDESIVTKRRGDARYLNGFGGNEVNEVALTGEIVTLPAIPTTAQCIELYFFGASLSGSNDILVQLSTGASFLAAGYDSSSSDQNSASDSVAGFIIRNFDAADTQGGMMRLVKSPGSNKWAETHGTTRAGGGWVDLGGAIDGLRIISTGLNMFDGGTVSMRYWV